MVFTVIRPFCPVVVVGKKAGVQLCGKLLNGIVLERVVEFSDLFTLPFWTQNFNTKEM